MRHITHWGYDDWHGLFVDGRLVDEGHQIRMWDLERAADGEPFTFEDKVGGERLIDYFERHGRFGHHTIADIERELDTYDEA